ncbi:MAG: glutathione peroxidase [Methylococcaceae bacterium]
MKILILLAGMLFFSISAVKAEPCSSLLNYKANQLRSKEALDFCKAFQGKVVLAVNTASNCGYTPQFKGLEALYQKYKDQGLVVVGFPSNDFNQEFDESEKTAKVCYINYGVTFPMVEKSAVSGTEANTFFKQLLQVTGQAPEWNFYKYLIARDGSTVTAFASNETPEQLDSKIHGLLLLP